jgi:hypothetical protein
MFKKLGRGLAIATGQKREIPVQFEVSVLSCDGLPSVKKVLVSLSRGTKEALTEVSKVKKGSAAFKEVMSFVGTLTQDVYTREIQAKVRACMHGTRVCMGALGQ